MCYHEQDLAAELRREEAAKAERDIAEGALALVSSAHQSAAANRDKYLSLLIEMHRKVDALMAWDNNIIDEPHACAEYKQCVQDVLEITGIVRDVLASNAKAEEMAMINVVELANAAMHLRNHGDPHGQMGRIFDQLTHALSLLPIAPGQPAATEPAKQAGRGPLGCDGLLGADHQPGRKP